MPCTLSQDYCDVTPLFAKKYTSVLMPQIKECVVKQGNKTPPANQQSKQTKNNPKSKSKPQPPKQKQNKPKSAVLPGSWTCLMNLLFVSPSRYSLNSFDRLAAPERSGSTSLQLWEWGCQPHFLLLKRKPNSDPCFRFFALPQLHSLHLEPGRIYTVRYLTSLFGIAQKQCLSHVWKRTS